MYGIEKLPACTQCSPFISISTSCAAVVAISSQLGDVFSGGYFTFRTGSKNSEDDPADDREETIWFDWFWYQSWQRRGISGARKTSDHLVDCPKHQERVSGDGQKLSPRISKQPQGMICGRDSTQGAHTICED